MSNERRAGPLEGLMMLNHRDLLKLTKTISFYLEFKVTLLPGGGVVLPTFIFVLPKEGEISIWKNICVTAEVA